MEVENEDEYPRASNKLYIIALKAFSLILFVEGISTIIIGVVDVEREEEQITYYPTGATTISGMFMFAAAALILISRKSSQSHMPLINKYSLMLILANLCMIYILFVSGFQMRYFIDFYNQIPFPYRNNIYYIPGPFIGIFVWELLLSISLIVASVLYFLQTDNATIQKVNFKDGWIMPSAIALCVLGIIQIWTWLWEHIISVHSVSDWDNDGDLVLFIYLLFMGLTKFCIGLILFLSKTLAMCQMVTIIILVFYVFAHSFALQFFNSVFWFASIELPLCALIIYLVIAANQFQQHHREDILLPTTDSGEGNEKTITKNGVKAIRPLGFGAIALGLVYYLQICSYYVYYPNYYTESGFLTNSPMWIWCLFPSFASAIGFYLLIISNSKQRSFSIWGIIIFGILEIIVLSFGIAAIIGAVPNSPYSGPYWNYVQGLTLFYTLFSLIIFLLMLPFLIKNITTTGHVLCKTSFYDMWIYPTAIMLILLGIMELLYFIIYWWASLSCYEDYGSTIKTARLLYAYSILAPALHITAGILFFFKSKSIRYMGNAAEWVLFIISLVLLIYYYYYVDLEHEFPPPFPFTLREILVVVFMTSVQIISHFAENLLLLY